MLDLKIESNEFLALLSTLAMGYTVYTMYTKRVAVTANKAAATTPEREDSEEDNASVTDLDESITLDLELILGTYRLVSTQNYEDLLCLLHTPFFYRLLLRYISQTFVASSADGQNWELSIIYGWNLQVMSLQFRLGQLTEGMDMTAGTHFKYMFEAKDTNRLTSMVTLEKEMKTGYRRVISDRVFTAEGMVQTVTFQEKKDFKCTLTWERVD